MKQALKKHITTTTAMKETQEWEQSCAVHTYSFYIQLSFLYNMKPTSLAQSRSKTTLSEWEFFQELHKNFCWSVDLNNTLEDTRNTAVAMQHNSMVILRILGTILSNSHS